MTAGSRAYYGSIHLLGYVMGVEHASHLVTFVSAAALPIGCVLLLRRLELSLRPSLLSFAFVYTYSFNSGFIAFCLGFDLAVFALVAFHAFIEKPRWLLGVFNAVAGFAIYFFHILAWGFWGGGTLIIAALSIGRVRLPSIVLRLLVTLPGVVGGALVTMRGSNLHMGAVGQLRFANYSIETDLAQYFTWIWDACADNASQMVGKVLVFGAVLLLAWTFRPKRREDCEPPRIFRRLQSLRGWSHGKEEQVPSRSA